jgi:hypothetical protein
MQMNIQPIEKVIPEANIIVFCPHYDDFSLDLGGYIIELKERGILQSKHFHILLVFSTSNYLTAQGERNFDVSQDRIKYATGRRVIEDNNCIDELLGEHQYRYELMREREAMLRSKVFADSEMEYAQGGYNNFSEEDHQIFSRLQHLVKEWASQENTALVFPLAIKEHIDHFILREAAIQVANEMKDMAKASFYFVEDRPYAGIMAAEDVAKLEKFISFHNLQPRVFRHHPDEVVDLVFKHYISLADDVYRKGVVQRSQQLQEEHDLDVPCDRILWLPINKS